MSLEDRLIQGIDTVLRLRQAGRLSVKRVLRRLYRAAVHSARQQEVMQQERRSRRERKLGDSIRQSTTDRRDYAMRILANFGSKTNGEMYSVTFETMGDVSTTQAPQTVDELFRLAKEAIQRQLGGTTAQPQPATTVTIPQPKVTTQPAAANGDRPKPQIKDPTLPATDRQLGLLRKLARRKGLRFDVFNGLTMGQASAKIDEFMAL